MDTPKPKPPMINKLVPAVEVVGTLKKSSEMADKKAARPRQHLPHLMQKSFQQNEELLKLQKDLHQRKNTHKTRIKK